VKSRIACMAIMALISLLAVGPALAQGTRLLREPTVSADQIAFVYANDIWAVSRSGGEAHRITTASGAEVDPRFSPDGSLIAFTGEYDGNVDVYVVAATGGTPERLTYHPDADRVRGWTPDGQRVLFASGRASAPVPYGRLWTISIDDGMPEPLPMTMANRGVYSPDGKRMAYVPIPEAFYTWRHYRGGRTTPIWIIDLSDYSVEKVPRENSNDTEPMWVGNALYFLSDRNGCMNLFSYDFDGKQVRQLTQHKEFDIKSASAGAGAVVYEQAGYVHLFDPKTGR
jgi:tricorn protease